MTPFLRVYLKIDCFEKSTLSNVDWIYGYGQHGSIKQEI